MAPHSETGRVVSINVSDGGVPKLPVERAHVSNGGLEGDRHNDTEHHGGPNRAVCVYPIELIERLQGEGHPIAPGTSGENLTVSGIDWDAMVPGARLVLEGGVELEVLSYTSPCKTISASFAEGQFGRISQKVHPGESRVYCRVLVEGEVARGEEVRLIAGDTASTSADDES